LNCWGSCIGDTARSQLCTGAAGSSWGSWGGWSGCSSSCGPGFQTRTKVSGVNPTPRFSDFLALFLTRHFLSFRRAAPLPAAAALEQHQQSRSLAMAAPRRPGLAAGAPGITAQRPAAPAPKRAIRRAQTTAGARARAVQPQARKHAPPARRLRGEGTTNIFFLNSSACVLFFKSLFEDFPPFLFSLPIIFPKNTLLSPPIVHVLSLLLFLF